MRMLEHRKKLITFLTSVAKPGWDLADIDCDQTNLLQSGVLDSFAIIQIIHYLEQSYDIDLSELGIEPADLVSIGGILSTIERSLD